MRFTMLALVVLQLTSCITYRDDDRGLGDLVRIQSLKQLEGTYANHAIDRGALAKPSIYNTLASHFGMVRYEKNGLYADIKDTARFFRIVYVNEQQLYFQTFDAAGQQVDAKYVTAPRDFVLKDGAMFEPTNRTGGVIPGHNTFGFTVNKKGSLVLMQKNTGSNLLILAVSHTTDYYEYPRVQH